MNNLIFIWKEVFYMGASFQNAKEITSAVSDSNSGTHSPCI